MNNDDGWFHDIFVHQNLNNSFKSTMSMYAFYFTQNRHILRGIKKQFNIRSFSWIHEPNCMQNSHYRPTHAYILSASIYIGYWGFKLHKVDRGGESGK